MMCDRRAALLLVSLLLACAPMRPAMEGADAGAAPPGFAAAAERSQLAASGLKGGDVDDNERFEEYQDYLARYRGGSVLPVDVSERVVVQALDARERPVCGAELELWAAGERIARARCHGDGRAILFPRALSGLASGTEVEVVATLGELSARQAFRRDSRDWTIVLPGAVESPAPPVLELAFCLDATGSMGDELARVQSTLTDVARQIAQLPGAPRVRWGLVAYRDRGDEYVSRRWRMTDSLDAILARLGEVRAGGGGDHLEAMNEGVHRAVRDLDWTEPRAIRLVFLVADAGPHLDYQDDVPYTESIRFARELGVKIYPIAASGLDPAGEYAMRQMAQQTRARFVFITYGGQTPHDVGSFANNDLDQLILGIVRRELDAAQGSRPSQ